MSKIITLVPGRSATGRGFLARTRAAWRSFTRPINIKDPALAKFFGTGYESASGVRVTPENAFTFSAVFDAVNQISSDIAKLPLNLRKRRKDGGSEPYEASKVYQLLKIQPNPEMGSMVFRRTLQAHALTCHGGYAEIERDGNGLPAALWILTPDRVEPRRPKRTDGSLGPVEYSIDGGRTILPARDVIHLQGLGYDGYLGYSVIDKARQTIGLALAAEAFGAKYFGKGTIFGGWLETDSDLDEDQKKEILENVAAFRNSQDSAWRILVTGLGHKFHQFDAKPRDSQMDELRVRQVEEVARFFRMAPYRLGVNTPGAVSYASVEAANLDYYTGCLLDWTTLWEQELQRKLVPQLEWRQQFIKHNVNAFLRGTIKDRFDALAIAHDRGVINADDWLELEDMNPQPGGQGKVYLVQGAMVPKDSLIDLAKAKVDLLLKKNAEPASAPPALNPAPAADELNAARARAERAEALVEDVRTELEAARTRLVAAEASGTATATELDHLRADATRMDQLNTQLTAIAEFVRERSVQLQTDLDAARTDAEEQRRAAASAAASEVTVRELRDALAVAEASVAEARATAQTIEQRLQQATEAATAAREAADAAAARVQLLEGSSHDATEARVQAEADARAAAARADAAADDRQRLTQELAEARAAITQAEQPLVEREAELEAARRSVTEGAEQLAAATRSRGELEAQLAAVRAERETLEAQLAAEREAARVRRLATIAAHRGLIVDALGRMVRREAEQARRRMATPEKLRGWLEGFPTLHQAVCVEALTPAIRTRLAWRQSSDDAVAVTTAIVREHLALFTQQLTAVLETDAREFHAELERVLGRWERDRPDAVADALLAQDVSDVAA